jgi:hypothetical protein
MEGPVSLESWGTCAVGPGVAKEPEAGQNVHRPYKER